MIDKNNNQSFSCYSDRESTKGWAQVCDRVWCAAGGGTEGDGDCDGQPLLRLYCRHGLQLTRGHHRLNNIAIDDTERTPEGVGDFVVMIYPRQGMQGAKEESLGSKVRTQNNLTNSCTLLWPHITSLRFFFLSYGNTRLWMIPFLSKYMLVKQIPAFDVCPVSVSSGVSWWFRRCFIVYMLHLCSNPTVLLLRTSFCQFNVFISLFIYFTVVKPDF